MNSVKYDGPGLKGNIDPDIRMLDVCSTCGIEHEFKLEVTMSDNVFWFCDTCICEHVTIYWVEDLVEKFKKDRV